MSNASNRSRLALDMRFYAILSHIFPLRFSHKVALIACLGMQIPWVSLTMYLTPLSDRLALSLIDLAVIGGTLMLGVLLTCTAMQALMVPLYRIHAATRASGEIGRLPEHYRDEMGEVMKLVNRLSTEAVTDPLTGLLNRKGLLEGIKACPRGAVIVFDLNQFKQINDTYGHQIGDQVLVQVAQCLKGQIRQPRDLLARWGGDEFLMVLRDATEGSAQQKAWDIEALLARCWLDGSVRPAPSVSFGIQMLTGDNFQTDIEQADQAMYEHKALRSDGVSGLTNHRSIHGV